MKTRKHGLSKKEMELVQYLMSDCKSTGDIQEKLNRLFAGTIEQMLEAMRTVFNSLNCKPYYWEIPCITSFPYSLSLID